MENERENNVYLANVAEQAERFGDMVECAKKIAMLDTELTVEERNIFSISYKSFISSPRASLRIISSFQEKEESKGNDKLVESIKDYRQTIENEFTRICNECLNILRNHLIPSATSAESSIFFYKMEGDYYRYLAEVKMDEERKDAADNSLKSYQMATDLANTNLPPTHPSRLGLALNFAVFYYDVMNSIETASAIAKKAFDDSIAELDTLSDETYKDSTLIMQLLRENLTLWNSDLAEDGDFTLSEVPKIAEPSSPEAKHQSIKAVPDS